MYTSGTRVALIVVISHTTTAVASQAAGVGINSPFVTAAPRASAAKVMTNALLPIANDAYPCGSRSMNLDRRPITTEKNSQATINPCARIETPGTIHAATKSPAPHAATRAPPRSKTSIRPTTVSSDDALHRRYERIVRHR